MKTYGARVRVPKPGGVGTHMEWTEISAQNPAAARTILEAMYGRGNVMSVPILVG